MDELSPRLTTRRFIWAIIVLVQCGIFNSARAQAGAVNPLARATAMSAAGQFGEVVALLKPYVDEHPSSAEAWILLAEHQYWSGDHVAAQSTYERAIEKHPVNALLRLSYARYLIDNGYTVSALRTLRPIGTQNADAEALRGTAAWWGGNLTKAAGHFKRALDVNPRHTEAARGLAAIRAGARPWLRLNGERGSDNQPLSRVGATLEAGMFLTPLQSLYGEVWHGRYVSEDPAGPITRASVVARGFWPSFELESDVGLGVVSRTDTTDWTGILAARVRLPHGLKVGGKLERAPYLYTVASVSQSVLTTEAQLHLSLNRQRWLGEAAVGRTKFPDDNVAKTAYGWLMARLYDSKALTMQAGYAFSFKNTREHRFTPVMVTSPRPGHLPEWQGRYVPYHTPLNVRTHSATASLSIRPVGAVTVRLSGSYAFAGREEAPFVYLIGRAPVTDVYEHRIHPWKIRSSVSADLSQSLSIRVEGSHMSTTWYNASSLDLSLYVRF